MRRPRRVAILVLTVGLPLLLAVLSTPPGTLFGAGGPADFVAGGPSDLARADIPADYLALYRAAGARHGVDWAVLAAIGKIETDHGRSPSPGVHAGQNRDGCCAGPMQFYNNRSRSGGRTTWDAFGVDGNGDGVIDIYEPADAIFAAGRYVAYLLANERSGRGRVAARACTVTADARARNQLRRALWGYNNACWYTEKVLEAADGYRSAAGFDRPAEALAVALDLRGVEVIPMPFDVAARSRAKHAAAAAVAMPAIRAILQSWDVHISSAHRPPAENRRAGGAARSDHICGLGIDFAGGVSTMRALAAWAAAQPQFAYVDGPGLGGGPGGYDGNHDDHVHISFARCP